MGWVVNASPEVSAKSQYVTIIVICVLLTTLSLVVVSSRLLIRHRARGLAKDDYMSILSEVFVIIYAGLCIGQTRYGLGLPPAIRPKVDLEPYTKINFAGRPFYQLGISFFKIALLISYLRLLEGTAHRNYRRIVWGIAILVFASHLACTLSLIFACNPVQKSWIPATPGTCLAAGPSFTGYAVVTIVSDVVVAIVPVPVLLKLNIPLNKKLGLIGVFALGLFTTVCSVLRYLEINTIQYGDGNSTMLVLWGVIEFNVGNITSSLPFLAPVFIRKAKQYRTKQYSGNNSSSKGGSRFWGGGVSSGNKKSGAVVVGDSYKLSQLSGNKSVSGMETTGSEENILYHGQHHQNGAIMKSMTYTVEVHEDPEDQHDAESRGSRGRHDV